MILCRFADQTAVQLPPERRLIGRTLLKTPQSSFRSSLGSSLTHFNPKPCFLWCVANGVIQENAAGLVEKSC